MLRNRLRARFMIFTLVMTAAAFRLHGAPEEERPTYRLSYEPDVEVLSLSSFGGMRDEGTRFHLFGDGRVVREKVHQGLGTITRTDEGYLSPGELDRLFETIVAAGLPEMTAESFREAAGGILPDMIDGSTTKIQLHFESYQRPGEAAMNSFEATVSMGSPYSLADRYFPHLPQPHAFVKVRETLEATIKTPTAKSSRARRESKP